MRRSSFFLGLAACVTAALLGTSQAKAGTVVTSDSGNLSTFTATNAGVVGSGVGAVTTLDITFTSPNSQRLASVNGIALSPLTQPAAFTLTEVVTLTNAGSIVVGGNTITGYTTSTTTYTKTFGTSPAIAQLTFNLSNGASAQDGGLNLNGHVTGVVTNSLPGYNFSPFNNGLGTINFALSGTTYSPGVSTFGGVIANAGSSVSGSGSFSEANVVPEPTSMALLGIGMAGFFAYRRLFKRPATV